MKCNPCYYVVYFFFQKRFFPMEYPPRKNQSLALYMQIIGRGLRNPSDYKNIDYKIIDL